LPRWPAREDWLSRDRGRLLRPSLLSTIRKPTLLQLIPRQLLGTRRCFRSPRLPPPFPLQAERKAPCAAGLISRREEVPQLFPPIGVALVRFGMKKRAPGNGPHCSWYLLLTGALTLLYIPHGGLRFLYASGADDEDVFLTPGVFTVPLRFPFVDILAGPSSRPSTSLEA